MLYAANRDQDITLSDAKMLYWNKIEQSNQLLLFTLYIIIKIAEKSLEDAEHRSNKYLPSDEDKAFTPILYNNESFQKLVTDKGLNLQFKKLNFGEKADKDIVGKIYSGFAKEEVYKNYIKGAHTKESNESILLELFKYCRASEHFVELIGDHFFNWEDDKSIIIGSVKKIIKSLKNDGPLDMFPYAPDEETVREFGETLLLRTFEEDSELLVRIEPVLKNWDSDRVAIIDLIFLKMALTELIVFETIPSKVTINEYVELAKTYSTPKSKEFINGVLDALVNDLTASNLIRKKGRGLID